MEPHKVLIVGSGGRENALAWKISQSRFCEKLFIAPGNAGTSFLGENVEISITDFPAIRDLILKNEISVVIVGPEEPLVNGLHDFLANEIKNENFVVIGPKKNGAALEGSKEFAKEFMLRHKIPTARYRTFIKKKSKKQREDNVVTVLDANADGPTNVAFCIGCNNKASKILPTVGP